MWLTRTGPLLAPLIGLSLVGCLPDNPNQGTDSDTGTETTGDPEVEGLFACEQAPCWVLVASQTLDDRVDVFDVGSQQGLRGRIGIDLKPDPSGQQLEGNLLDEPYGLVLSSALHVLVGHFPDIDRGSMLTYPLTAFNNVAPGGFYNVNEYFSGGEFQNGIQQLDLATEEPLFIVEQESGKLIVAAFKNSLTAIEWVKTSELLVLDPIDGPPAVLSLDILDDSCRGAWGMQALNAEGSIVAMACDGSDSLAMVSLPNDPDIGPADVVAQATGCSVTFPAAVSETWTTRFLAPDGAGGVIVSQSRIDGEPRLWHVNSSCGLSGAAGSDLPPGLEMVRSLREMVLLPTNAGTPYWLVASGLPQPGVAIIRGGASPSVCGLVSGLETAFTGDNDPYALVLHPDGTHLGIGAGPTINPELSEGSGQVLWVTLDTSQLEASCAVSATEVVDLTAGLFSAGDPTTWMRAPNILQLRDLGAQP